MAEIITHTYKCDLCGKTVDKADLKHLVQENLVEPGPDDNPWDGDRYHSDPVDVCQHCCSTRNIALVLEVIGRRKAAGELRQPMTDEDRFTHFVGRAMADGDC